MLFCSHKYLYHHFLQRKINGLVLLMFFATTGYSQNTLIHKDSLLTLHISPLSLSTHKKPLQLMILHINPPYKPYFVQRGGELMHWPSYPLTPGQIIARQSEWQRRNNQSVGEQIASDIIKNRVNALIYGRKTAPAAIPKF
jgi:hypothetical protein